MDRWVLVVDSDPVSQRQVEACRSTGACQPLKGAVRCDDAENASTPICHAVEYFPAFCDVNDSACVYGLRATEADITALAAASSSQRTTDPAPPPASR